MRVRFSTVAMFCAALAFGGSFVGVALAAKIAEPSVEPQRVELSVTPLTATTVRVKAKWAPSCDSLGCADRYTTQWSGAGATRSTSNSQLLDSVVVTLPAPGDSSRINITVAPVRRLLSGPSRTAGLWLRVPDRAPPAVDSIRLDTLAFIAEAAFRDTFPELVVRLSSERQDLAVFEQRVACPLYRNRYTGEVALGVPQQLQQDSARHGSYVLACEAPRRAYEAERGG